MKMLMDGEPHEVLFHLPDDRSLVVQIDGNQYRFLVEEGDKENGELKASVLFEYIRRAFREFRTEPVQEHPFLQTPIYRQRCRACAQVMYTKGGAATCGFCGGALTKDLELSHYNEEGEHWDD